jgi:hypothetical protein
MPPPEFHPPRWRESIMKLKKENIQKIAPTHFGIYDDVNWHLNELVAELDIIENWMSTIMPRGMEIEELRKEFLDLVKTRAREVELGGAAVDALEKANPSGISADGIKRYWDKYIKQD